MNIYLFMKIINDELYQVIYLCELTSIDCKGDQLSECLLFNTHSEQLNQLYQNENK
jgi:hypothetical protein